MPDWIIDRPETLIVFQELLIDYTCDGMSLEFACREGGDQHLIQTATIAHEVRLFAMNYGPDQQPTTCGEWTWRKG